MWFRFPDGCDMISVAGQQFLAETKDDAGNQYFRAPDHFAPAILDQPGFKVATPEEVKLPDLPKGDPDKDTAINQLATQIDALKMERDDARNSLVPLQEENLALRKLVSEFEAEKAQAAADEATAKGKTK